MLITTPINAYVFSAQLDTPEDFFLSYPSLKIKNDTLYFKGSSKVLLLLDRVPISSLKGICFPSIEKVEVVAQDVSSLYGDYDAVVNIITKKPQTEIPYSKVKLYKNPDHVQIEFGRKLLRDIGFYLTGDLNSTSQWNANFGYTTKFASFQTYFSNEFILQGSLLSNIKFYLKQDLFSITNLWTLKEHKILLGTETRLSDYQIIRSAFFIQDYWEPYPLLYVVPGVRYDEQFYPKISVGFIPHLNVTVFGSLTQVQTLLGIRVFDSNICISKTREYPLFTTSPNDYQIETNIVSPWIWNCKLTVSCHLPLLSNYQTITLSDYLAITLEYQKEFKNRDLGVYVLGDLNNLRVELKIIDAKIFYRLQKASPSFGFLWEFWE